jgi:tryptophan synthase alpha chain
MGRIDDIFAAARREGQGLVLPFLTGGYPDPHSWLGLLGAVERAGASIVEVGIPFSDPIADGPVIASSMHAALTRGATPAGIFEAIRSLRERRGPGSSLALVAMVSVSIVQRIGRDRFVGMVASAGLAGIIVPDIDLEDAEGLSASCRRHELACAYLIAPNSRPERAAAIARHCVGFAYLLARAGVTGAHGAQANLVDAVAAIRAAVPQLPIAAGFGISTPDDVRATLAQVDGAIVGSAIVRQVTEASDAGHDPAPLVERMVGALVAAAATVRRSATAPAQ